MKLYEFAPTRSLRALWALHVLHLDFEAIPVDLPGKEHLSPEFLRINPAGRVPVLVDGDMVVTESVAIVLYLCDKAGKMPADLGERGQVYRWCLFAATELEQPLWRLSKSNKVEADQPVARQDFLEMAKVSEAHLAGREFMVGEGMTAADFVMAYTLDWANELGLLAEMPHSRAYVDRLYARPEAPDRIAKALASVGLAP